MIEIHNLTKQFEDIRAVDEVSVEIKEKTVFGLIGTNGAGKSTVLRMIAGVIKPDEGTVAVDNMPVYDNVEAKKRLFFIADEPYFFVNSNARAMEKYYSGIYEAFDREEFYRYLEKFNLDKNRKISTFSAKEMEERGLTPVIASHNLRELEDICDHVGLLHKGGVLLSRDLEDMKCNIQKVQCVFSAVEDELKALNGLEVLKKEQRGSLCTITVRSTREEVEARFATVDTIFYEVLPLSLEEIFISETEVVGYDIKKLILG